MSIYFGVLDESEEFHVKFATGIEVSARRSLFRKTIHRPSAILASPLCAFSRASGQVFWSLPKYFLSRLWPSKASLYDMVVCTGGEGQFLIIFRVSYAWIFVCSAAPLVQIYSIGLIYMASVLNCFKVKSSVKDPRLNWRVDMSK